LKTVTSSRPCHVVETLAAKPAAPQAAIHIDAQGVITAFFRTDKHPNWGIRLRCPSDGAIMRQLSVFKYRKGMSCGICATFIHYFTRAIMRG
jgi:hypothetical protein